MSASHAWTTEGYCARCGLRRKIEAGAPCRSVSAATLTARIRAARDAHIADLLARSDASPPPGYDDREYRVRRR
jgi:hypothetical protein